MLVVPRLGTMSPWSSKATDIAHICGLTRVRAHRARHPLRRRRRGGRRGGAAARAARPHDRVGAGSHAAKPRRCSSTRPRARSRASRWAPGGRARARARERDAGPGAVARRDRLPGRRLPRAGPRSDRRRADDVRPGQQRALPAQDLQRRVRRRRPAAAAVAVPDDPPQHRGEPGRRAVRLQRQRRGDRRARRAAASSPIPTTGVYGAQPEPIAHPDEGRDPQPPDRDLAVPGRGHRLGRRDPRRGRHRAGRASQGGADRLLGVEPAPAGRGAPLGEGPRQARPHRRARWRS